MTSISSLSLMLALAAALLIYVDAGTCTCNGNDYTCDQTGSVPAWGNYYDSVTCHAAGYVAGITSVDMQSTNGNINIWAADSSSSSSHYWSSASAGCFHEPSLNLIGNTNTIAVVVDCANLIYSCSIKYKINFSCYPVYTWQQLPPSACSASCGGGTTTISYGCFDPNSLHVSDNLCTTAKPSTITSSCNSQACPPAAPPTSGPYFSCFCCSGSALCTLSLVGYAASSSCSEDGTSLCLSQFPSQCPAAGTSGVMDVSCTSTNTNTNGGGSSRSSSTGSSAVVIPPSPPSSGPYYSCNCCSGSNCASALVGYAAATSCGSDGANSCRSNFPTQCPALGSNGIVSAPCSSGTTTSTSTSSTSWAGTWRTDGACNQGQCCCMNGDFTVQHVGSNFVLNSPVSGQCGGTTTASVTGAYPTSNTFTTSQMGDLMTLTLSTDGNTITETDISYPQCGGSATRVNGANGAAPTNIAFNSIVSMMAIVAIVALMI